MSWRLGVLFFIFWSGFIGALFFLGGHLFNSDSLVTLSYPQGNHGRWLAMFNGKSKPMLNTQIVLMSPAFSSWPRTAVTLYNAIFLTLGSLGAMGVLRYFGAGKWLAFLIAINIFLLPGIQAFAVSLEGELGLVCMSFVSMYFLLQFFLRKDRWTGAQLAAALFVTALCRVDMATVQLGVLYLFFFLSQGAGYEKSKYRTLIPAAAASLALLPLIWLLLPNFLDWWQLHEKRPFYSSYFREANIDVILFIQRVAHWFYGIWTLILIAAISLHIPFDFRRNFRTGFLNPSVPGVYGLLLVLMAICVIQWWIFDPAVHRYFFPLLLALGVILVCVFRHESRNFQNMLFLSVAFFHIGVGLLGATTAGSHFLRIFEVYPVHAAKNEVTARAGELNNRMMNHLKAGDTIGIVQTQSRFIAKMYDSEFCISNRSLCQRVSFVQIGEGNQLELIAKSSPAKPLKVLIGPLRGDQRSNEALAPVLAHCPREIDKFPFVYTVFEGSYFYWYSLYDCR